MSDKLDDTEIAALRELLDRQAITECVLHSCRGVDRGDWDLFRSAYHADAVEDHGGYIGPFETFPDFLKGAMASFSGYQRHVSNIEIDLRGDEAHVESYYLITLLRSGATTVMVNGGRYLDRLERRDGRWGIATRVVTSEWHGTLEGGENVAAPESAMGFVAPRLDKEDLSYQRPLQVERPYR